MPGHAHSFPQLLPLCLEKGNLLLVLAIAFPQLLCCYFHIFPVVTSKPPNGGFPYLANLWVDFSAERSQNFHEGSFFFSSFSSFSFSSFFFFWGC
jgi:hypothetical protein